MHSHVSRPGTCPWLSLSLMHRARGFKEAPSCRTKPVRAHRYRSLYAPVWNASISAAHRFLSLSVCFKSWDLGVVLSHRPLVWPFVPASLLGRLHLSIRISFSALVVSVEPISISGPFLSLIHSGLSDTVSLTTFAPLSHLSPCPFFL